MQFLTDLWMPIVVSGLAVFFLSAMVWTVFPHHKKEWAGFPNEDAVASAIRASNVPAGLYHLPHSDAPNPMKDPQMVAKMESGPVAFVTVFPPMRMQMGPMMAKSVVSNVLIAAFTGYVAYHSLLMGAEYLTVFRIVGTVTFMAYAFGTMADSIWFGRPWKSWFLGAGDALMYALVSGGIFGWLWP